MTAGPLLGEVRGGYENQDTGHSTIMLESGLCITPFTGHINGTFFFFISMGSSLKTIKIR